MEMFHSSTPGRNKQVIHESLRDPKGKCRVVFATNALGIGINVNVFHYGPPSTLEAYMQEIGRAVRDGGESSAVIYYHGHQMQHTDLMIKTYVANSTECRRAVILSVFGTHSVTQHVQHKCCDICEMNCSCDDGGKCPCFKHSVPLDNSVAELFNTRPVRSVPAQKVHLVTTALHEY